MVHAWSNPLKIRLTDEGKTLAFKLHVAAESRGDCRCGLIDATSSEAKAALADETVDAGARNRAEGWRAASGEGGGRGASRNEAAPSTSPNAANAAANPRDAAAAAGRARRDARSSDDGVGNLDGARRFGPTRGSDDTNTQRV